LGSKIIGWALVGAAVFFIAQAASGPKSTKKTATNETTVSESQSNGNENNSARGGAVESSKVQGQEITFPILVYYNISSYAGSDQAIKSLHNSPKNFSQQLSYLKKNGFTVISADTAYNIVIGKANSPKKPVLLTFNDGYADFYRNALPILKIYHFPALVFVISNRPGDANFMSWKELRKLAASSVTIGSQAVSNVSLTKISSVRAKEELAISKKDIEGELGISIKYFNFPYGAYNSTIIANLDSSGYSASFTLAGVNASNKISPYTISRKVVKGGISLSEFAKLLD
jgi:peptidoglycan/xylan/chitin deacetylase (PgdA/CDA1 family)